MLRECFEVIVESTFGQESILKWIFKRILNRLYLKVCTDLKKVFERNKCSYALKEQNESIIAPFSSRISELSSASGLYWQDDDYRDCGLTEARSLKGNCGTCSSTKEVDREATSQYTSFNSTSLGGSALAEGVEGSIFWLEDTYGLHEHERLVEAVLARSDDDFLLHEEELLKNPGIAVSPTLLDDALERKMLIEAEKLFSSSRCFSENNSENLMVLSPTLNERDVVFSSLYRSSACEGHVLLNFRAFLIPTMQYYQADVEVAVGGAFFVVLLQEKVKAVKLIF
ncbi:unnamed protein product [Enterobius vermicularis]|uniref:Uncharacterized protein n=1 Tax=Enterobius vermicularis TaxID=51028 RepID=A0A0N4UZJ7_ENTVE|nr:unnamed protein product [Enterobius vermicularis]